ncbi:helicase-related protein [Coleofasciculus sp. FACHB-501]|uniref:helicase-related protein n=1 Tax=Cyanophyceae TaxID=3028117 RepID=UPI001F55A29E|nr:helicase-related protein [Coleofasciculus sp. FACHB-501]
MDSQRKPNSYWDELTNLERELMAFINEHGTLGLMPRAIEFVKAGRSDLANAMRKHGGFQSVAEKLGLTYARKRPGYWDEFTNVKQNLFAFIEKNGVFGVMPTKQELQTAGYGDLANAIEGEYGGYAAVAKRLGLTCAKRQRGYSDDINNVKHEILAFVEKHGTPGVMPTEGELKKAGQGALLGAVKKHGGTHKVAELLGLACVNRQRGSLNDFECFAGELLAFIEKQGTAGVMPTQKELAKAKKTSLASAIARHGGFPTVAERLKLKFTHIAKPTDYWKDFANVERELFVFIGKKGTPGMMPEFYELVRAGHSSLASAIGRHGGFSAVAERLGLKLSYTAGWTVEAIRRFVASLINHLGTLTPAELYLLFQQNGMLQSTGSGKSFVKALATGRFPKEEIEKFVNGEPSTVDKFLQDKQLTLEALETSGNNDIPDKGNVTSQDNLDDQIDETIEPSEEEDDLDLPVVQTKEVLASLDHPVVSSADEEAVEFLIASAKAKIWKHVFRDEAAAVAQAQSYTGDSYAEKVKSEFLNEYHQAKNLPIPTGYAFCINGKIAEPNLMQRLAAVQVRDKKRVGNWSGTGAGKTLSAVLASRVINAHLTLICCPNSVVDGWKKAILNIFPDSAIATKTFTPDWANAVGDETGLGAALNLNAHRYIIVNYEKFQQPDSADWVRSFVESELIDFIVIDEIHYTKQRQVENISRRKQLVSALITAASDRNPNLHIIGMSATPVINNLQEGKSLVELVTGVAHDELDIHQTIANCMKLHQRLVTLGIRWMPDYKQQLGEPKDLSIPVDCSEVIDEIRALGRKGTHLALEQILTRARLPVIREQIKPKTLIYTHYVQGIDKLLRDALEDDGWKVGFYTGEVEFDSRREILQEFKEGNIDVLIGSSAIATGVDGLQQACNRLIINVLPWTHAEFEQLIGRIYRQGQQNPVTIVIPLTYAHVNGERWSWCDSKMQRLRFKKSIADAAVDGVVPEGYLRSPAQAYQDVIAWLEKLETGVQVIARPKIVIPIPDNDPADVQRRLQRYGDFSAMNRHWNQTRSETTHHRLQENPEEWSNYHTLYTESRKNWAVIPYEEMIRWCQQRSGYTIGDFGCGQAKLAEAVSDRHTVYSFDHVAVNQEVIACDMAHVPLDDQRLDVAIFCLSLMGANFTDYLREANRTLKLDGQLHIIEATSRFSDHPQFQTDLEALGFIVVSVQDAWKFTHIHALKTERRPQTTGELQF